jgi:hypothetical protein
MEDNVGVLSCFINSRLETNRVKYDDNYEFPSYFE